MYWELWHRQSANMIDDFPSLDEALAFVADVLTTDGQAVVGEWQLLPGDRKSPSLEGDDLLLVAAVAQGTAGSGRQPSQALAERVAHRFQSYEQRVRHLEKQLAAAQAERAAVEAAGTAAPAGQTRSA